MAMSVGPVTDEKNALLAFLRQQRDALRNAVYELSEDQARAVPSASALSLGGLLKHAAIGERDWMDRILGRVADVDWQSGFQEYFASFQLAADETLAGWVARYEEIARETESVVADIADLSQFVPAPASWQGTPLMPAEGGWTVRWILFHMIEEAARHAGHADVIRETLDGQQAGQLMALAEGWPAGWDSWVTGDRAA